jgi:hypothetical protein
MKTMKTYEVGSNLTRNKQEKTAQVPVDLLKTVADRFADLSRDFGDWTDDELVEKLDSLVGMIPTKINKHIVGAPTGSVFVGQHGEWHGHDFSWCGDKPEDCIGVGCACGTAVQPLTPIHAGVPQRGGFRKKTQHF